jgi:hypothetical protein
VPLDGALKTLRSVSIEAIFGNTEVGVVSIEVAMEACFLERDLS